MREPNHLRRIAIIWIALVAVALPLVIFVWGPSLPPGGEADDAAGQVIDETVLAAVATPITLGLIVYFAYALIVFRDRGPERGEGVAIRGNRRVAKLWLIHSIIAAIGLATFGTVRLLEGGAGGGQGPDPLVGPSAQALEEGLEIQVIAQQWDFTYRYPEFGIETPKPVLPVDREVEIHVTSLDVVHSFWAYQLGVKADANPGVDNVTYVKPTDTGNFEVRCAELCGLWHGHMYDEGRVVSDAEFEAWIDRERKRLAPAAKVLPAYRYEYFPPPERRGG